MALSSTLGFSRRVHFWCSHSTDAEHTYESLIRAFEWFGGVPREVLVDNQKAAVLEHPRGGLVKFHPQFLDLAELLPRIDFDTPSTLCFL